MTLSRSLRQDTLGGLGGDSTHSFSFKRRLEDGLLVGIDSFGLVEVLDEKPLEKGVEADAGHAVDGHDDLLLQEVVRLSLQDVDEHLEEVHDQVFDEDWLKINKN